VVIAGSSSDGGGDETVMAEAILARAAFLLSLQPRPDVVSSAVTRKRWQVVSARAAHMTPRLSDAGAVGSGSPGPPAASESASPRVEAHVGLADIVQDAVASADLDQLQSFRQLLMSTPAPGSSDGAVGAGKPTHALVCDFLKDTAPIGLPVLKQALEARDVRAGLRLRGLLAMLQLLEEVHTHTVRLWALQSFHAAIRACALHPLHRVNGCSTGTRARLLSAFGRLLAQLGRLLDEQVRAEMTDVHINVLSLSGLPKGGAGVDVLSPSQVCMYVDVIAGAWCLLLPLVASGCCWCCWCCCRLGPFVLPVPLCPTPTTRGRVRSEWGTYPRGRPCCRALKACGPTGRCLVAGLSVATASLASP
jgi:hypothetical protein